MNIQTDLKGVAFIESGGPSWNHSAASKMESAYVVIMHYSEAMKDLMKKGINESGVEQEFHKY